ncbi:uncharacterized protein L969DRAFT_92050 [Mixia osmundae IAM 14324]|uniref:uncharacterized protein n=1 Tax=Mixia osmundae (strain CBS 9802 / IAM 14324 / JCM 22182 / KY 12970) TaxID=764103 RepID=UPI0004A550E7|nr:uncharacterized protein L969DRAFT_92050 [Mixia osmundae IAM 14324]KEI42616.1 hypothetical protein L969DRAFT_92050 [Mixia osmundae IAM 14324]
MTLPTLHEEYEGPSPSSGPQSKLLEDWLPLGAVQQRNRLQDIISRKPYHAVALLGSGSILALIWLRALLMTSNDSSSVMLGAHEVPIQMDGLLIQDDSAMFNPYRFTPDEAYEDSKDIVIDPFKCRALPKYTSHLTACANSGLDLTEREVAYRGKQYKTRTLAAIPGVQLANDSLDESRLARVALKDPYASRDLPDEKISEILYDLSTDRHLTDTQCAAIFPGLFEELDRAASYWRERGGIHMRDLDKGMPQANVHVIIKRNRLYLKEPYRIGPNSRTRATLAAINDAIVTAVEPIPDVEFILTVEDMVLDKGTVDQSAMLALGRKKSQPNLWLMPDYGFYAWPEPAIGAFLDVQDQTLAFESRQTWQDKFGKLFWRGALLNQLRTDMALDMTDYDWAAIQAIDWKHPDNVLSPAEHCKYKYLLHVEGIAYSGRLKYLLQCRSVTVIHDLEHSNTSSPDQNIIMTPAPKFDHLPAVMSRLVANDAYAERIANQSFAYWRKMLSPASTDCYCALWRTYADVQSFKPELTAASVPYASFKLTGTLKWNPN